MVRILINRIPAILRQRGVTGQQSALEHLYKGQRSSIGYGIAALGVLRVRIDCTSLPQGGCGTEKEILEGIRRSLTAKRKKTVGAKLYAIYAGVGGFTGVVKGSNRASFDEEGAHIIDPSGEVSTRIGRPTCNRLYSFDGAALMEHSRRVALTCR